MGNARQFATRTGTFPHAWWRSGSTYVWLKLRENASARCYYEPLHEKISFIDLPTVEGGPEAGISENLRHPAAKENYFAEFAELLRSNELRFVPELSYDRYFLTPKQADPKLANYLRGLISSANAAQRRAILCFCRSQLRSAWMKEKFGGIHIAQIRNPFDQWASFKVSAYFPIGVVLIALKLRAAHPRAFAHIEQFERLAQQLSRPRSVPMEVIAGQFISQRDCFDIGRVIWIASTLQAIDGCDYLLDIDRLATDPTYQDTTSGWFGSIGCSVDFSDCSLPTSSALNSQISALEPTIKSTAVAMRSGASTLLVNRPKAVRKMLPSLSPISQRILRLLTEAD